MAEEYTESKDADGNRIVALEGGDTIPIDAENPEFCQFLNSMQVIVVANTQIRNRYHCFCRKMKEEFLKHVRSRGIILSTRSLGVASGYALSVTDGISSFPDGFQMLNCARASDKKSDTDGVTEFMSNVNVSVPLLDELNDELSVEASEIRRRSSWKVVRAFVYIDVSDFSEYPAGQQALIIASLGSMTSGDNDVPIRATDVGTLKTIEERFCIGDGYIYSFERSIEATYFAAALARDIEKVTAMDLLPVNFHFRMGVHVGPVFQFWDYGRDGWNYIGDSINGGSRVLEAIGKKTDDVVFVSDAVRKDILDPFKLKTKREKERATKLIEWMQTRGRRKDKHKKMWRVYELNHMNVK